MTTYKKLFTECGQEKITDAVCDNGELKISKIVIGDGNGSLYDPVKTQTALVNQLNVLDITDFEKNGNVCRFFAEIPAETDYYIIREIGLIDEDNDLIWISQFEMETVSNIDNVVTENIIGIQLEFEQGVTISLVDTSVLMASREYVDSTFQKLSEKGHTSGYCPLDENAKVPELYLPETLSNTDLSNLTENGSLQTNIIPLSVISGNYTNSTGYPDLISSSGVFKVSDITGDYQPLKVAFSDGKIQTFTDIEDIDASSLSNGTYNLYLDKEGNVYPLANEEYASRIAPGGGTTTIEYVTHTNTITSTVYQMDNDITIVGSPAITTEGLASNFTSSSYFEINTSGYSTTNWEMQLKFKATDVNTRQPLCGDYFWNSATGVRFVNGCNIILNSGKVTVYIGRGSGVNSTTGMDITDGGFTVSANTWYTIKVSYNGTTYTTTCNSSVKTYNSNNNVKWISNYRIGARREVKEGSYSAKYTPAEYCMIDLQETYIKSDNSYVINNKTTTTSTYTYQEKVVNTTGSVLSSGDIWLDTSLKPYVLRQYSGNSLWNTIDYVRLPHQIVVSSGNITDITTVRPFNANGWDEQLSTPDLNRKTTLTNGSAFIAPYSGWVYNYTAGDTYYLEKGSSYTPNSSGTWYYSPIKGA